MREHLRFLRSFPSESERSNDTSSAEVSFASVGVSDARRVNSDEINQQNTSFYSTDFRRTFNQIKFVIIVTSTNDE